MNEGKQVMDHFLHVLPILNEMLTRDVGVGLTDREQYLYYKAGKKLDMKAYAGMPLKPGSAVVQAMEGKKRVIMRGDASIFGMPYIAAALPIFDAKGNVLGSVVTSEPVELQDTVFRMSSELGETISLLASTTEEISAQSQEIAGVCQQLTQGVMASAEEVKRTDSIIDMTRNIAGSINLLGLNAAIEAARVGEAGRGFGVVAQEIRKLSSETSRSIGQVDEVIRTIQADSNRNYSQLAQINQVINQLADAITHVAETIQQAGGMVHELNRLAESLSDDEG
ncbi:MAG TPA: methyl-accepting chemotaxis protein [Patescibacteria group bacterium]|nr:methyl-accepting chemotaxis protein [Patescibacteria group bacterium]